MTDKSVRVGVVGTGHLGSHHVKHFANINEATLIGVFDNDQTRFKEIAKKNNTKSFSTLKALICIAYAIFNYNNSSNYNGFFKSY